MNITENEEGHKIVSMTLTLKVSRQDEVTNISLFEITDLELVRIDTRIEYVSCSYTSKDEKGHINVSLTLTFKVNC